MQFNKYHTEDISSKSFLVTGGAGFIGSNIVDYLILNKAKKVVVIDNLSSGYKKNIDQYLNLPNFEFINGDICNIEDCKKACKNIDYVFHQAALGSVPRSIKDPLATHSVNVTGFINILLSSKESGVKRIVYASSSSVYGDSSKMPKQEDNIGNQLSPYAVSKLTNELYADIFSKTYQMEIIGLRYFNVFGPKQSPNGEYAAVIPIFINSIIKGEKIKINGDGNQTRDFTFISNVVQSNIRSMFSPKIKNSVYNVGVGENISLNGLVDSIKNIIKKDVNIDYVGNREGDVRDSLADISKIKSEIGYNPDQSLNDGLELTINYMKNNHE